MRLAFAASLFALAPPAFAQERAEPVTPESVVAEAPPEEWIAIAPEDVLIMELAPGADGAGRYVVIQLMPPPFSQPWVANIRTLARAAWWDGLTVYRSVDNWVVQWGDVSEEKALPEGVVSPEVDYTSTDAKLWTYQHYFLRNHPDMFADPYWRGRGYAFAFGIPVAIDNIRKSGLPDDRPPRGWPIHCYGSVGVARDLAPDTGTGSELYAVIGHAPRQLDRNIAVVGRVIEGMEHLSTLPRGTGEAGVYESREEDTPIVSMRLASEHPDDAKFTYEYLDTASESFARYVQVRANRQDAFYAVPAGGVNICNVQVPVRLVEE